MDCTFYWYCYRRIDGTRQRIFFIGQLTVIYGFVATCIVLPIVFKRLKAFPLQTSIKPNTSTICAPFSLVAAAYVIAFPKANAFIVIILLLLAQIFYFYIIIQLPKLLKEPFSPVFSAFTFPLVISATALKNSLPVLMFPVIWKGLLFIEVLLATVIVLRVFIGYLHFFLKRKTKINFFVMRLSNTITKNLHAYLITKKGAGNLASF